MDENLSKDHANSNENHRTTAVSTLGVPTGSSIVEQGQRERGGRGSGASNPPGGTKTSASMWESLVPRKRAPKYPPPLPIPNISTAPSTASQYTLSTPKQPLTHLLPSASLPSPITPSNIVDSCFSSMNTRTRSSELELSSSRPNISSDVPSGSLWSPDYDYVPHAHTEEPWM